jgi:hypothetical protein
MSQPNMLVQQNHGDAKDTEIFLEDQKHIANDDGHHEQDLKATEFSENQLKSELDTLPLMKAIWAFRRVFLLCTIAGFTASTDGESPSCPVAPLADVSQVSRTRSRARFWPTRGSSDTFPTVNTSTRKQELGLSIQPGCLFSTVSLGKSTRVGWLGKLTDLVLVKYSVNLVLNTCRRRSVDDTPCLSSLPSFSL